MKSIRVFLVTIILAIFILFSFVAALKGYESSMREAEKLFDRQLLNTARLISHLPTGESMTHFDQDSTIAFQIWHQGVLVATSRNTASKAMVAFTPGFNFSNFSGYRWRTVALRFNNGDRWVLAAERTDLRYALAEKVTLESVFPIFISIPLLGLLIWLIVSRGLKPLQEFADELESKRANDLSPLTYPLAYQELIQNRTLIQPFIAAP